MTNLKIPEFKIDDRVAYSVQFLKSIGESHGAMSHARGNITAITPFGDRALISIEWDKGDDMPPKVLDANLAIVGANRRFCNVD